jgi:hypothetical protein
VNYKILNLIHTHIYNKYDKSEPNESTNKFKVCVSSIYYCDYLIFKLELNTDVLNTDV